MSVLLSSVSPVSSAFKATRSEVPCPCRRDRRFLSMLIAALELQGLAADAFANVPALVHDAPADDRADRPARQLAPGEGRPAGARVQPLVAHRAVALDVDQHQVRVAARLDASLVRKAVG